MPLLPQTAPAKCMPRAPLLFPKRTAASSSQMSALTGRGQITSHILTAEESGKFISSPPVPEIPKRRYRAEKDGGGVDKPFSGFY